MPFCDFARLELKHRSLSRADPLKIIASVAQNQTRVDFARFHHKGPIGELGRNRLARFEDRLCQPLAAERSANSRQVRPDVPAAAVDRVTLVTAGTVGMKEDPPSGRRL